MHISLVSLPAKAYAPEGRPRPTGAKKPADEPQASNLSLILFIDNIQALQQ